MTDNNLSQTKEESDSEFDNLIKVQTKLIELLKHFTESGNGIKQTHNCTCFRVLFVRIMVNFISINKIMPLIKTDSIFKLSLNILYRSVVDDVINILYLYCFYDADDIEQVSLGNELNVLGKEFLMSYKKKRFCTHIIR